MRVRRSVVLWVALVASALGLSGLGAQSASAAADPCLTSGYVRTAWGDVGAAGWYANSAYNVAYVNSSPWGSSNGVDHNLQWEMTYQSSTRTVKFCAQNLRAIGRTALKISTESFTTDGKDVRTPLVNARSVPAGAGWVTLSSSHLPTMAGYEVYLGDYWAGGTVHGWSNVTMRSYRCAASAVEASGPTQRDVPTPAGC